MTNGEVEDGQENFTPIFGHHHDAQGLLLPEYNGCGTIVCILCVQGGNECFTNYEAQP